MDNIDSSKYLILKAAIGDLHATSLSLLLSFVIVVVSIVLGNKSCVVLQVALDVGADKLLL
jgi:hypothetical protein